MHGVEHINCNHRYRAVHYPHSIVVLDYEYVVTAYITLHSREWLKDLRSKGDPNRTYKVPASNIAPADNATTVFTGSRYTAMCSQALYSNLLEQPWAPANYEGRMNGVLMRRVWITRGIFRVPFVNVSTIMMRYNMSTGIMVLSLYWLWPTWLLVTLAIHYFSEYIPCLVVSVNAQLGVL